MDVHGKREEERGEKGFEADRKGGRKDGQGTHSNLRAHHVHWMESSLGGAMLLPMCRSQARNPQRMNYHHVPSLCA